jgi:hypothetical protein
MAQDVATWAVPVILFLGGIVWGVTWYMLQRFVSAVDDLRNDLHGTEGPVAKLRGELADMAAKLPTYQTREDASVVARDVATKLDALRAESVAREDRIVGAIRDMGRTSQAESAAIRAELRAVHERVDRIRDVQAGFG